MYMYSLHTCTHIHIHTITVVNTHSCVGTHHTLHTKVCMCGVYVACYGKIPSGVMKLGGGVGAKRV